MKILVDHSRALFTDMSPVEVRLRADLLVARAEKIGQQRMAFVMRNQADYGLMRQLQGLTSEELPFDMHVFDDVAPARAWLDV